MVKPSRVSQNSTLWNSVWRRRTVPGGSKKRRSDKRFHNVISLYVSSPALPSKLAMTKKSEQTNGDFIYSDLWNVDFCQTRLIEKGILICLELKNVENDLEIVLFQVRIRRRRSFFLFCKFLHTPIFLVTYRNGNLDVLVWTEK